MKEIKPYVGANDPYKKYYIYNYCYYKVDNKKDEERTPITNDILESAIRVKDINGIQENVIRLKWKKHGLMEYSYNEMRRKIVEEGICLNKTSGQNLFDYMNATWFEETEENLSQGYVRLENIPDFEINIPVLKEAIEFFNGLMKALPFVQQQYVKSLICPNFHYILKENCTQNRNLIKTPIINGVTGASKTALVMLIYYIFNINAPYDGLETTPFEFNTTASIRNSLSKNATIVPFDEMDEYIIQIRGNKQMKQEFKDLIKNTFKIKLKGTADLNAQGENKEYHFLGAPVITLNSDVIIENATQKRVHYFKCTDPFDLREYAGKIEIDTINTLRELGKAIWKIVKTDMDFDKYDTDEDILKDIVKKVNKMCGYNEQDEDRLVDLHNIKDSKMLDTISETLFMSLNYTINNGESVVDTYKWVKVNKNNKLLIHPTIFCESIQELCKDNTLGRQQILSEFDLDKKETVSKYWTKNTQKLFVFNSAEEFLKYIGFCAWKCPEDDDNFTKKNERKVEKGQ